MEISGAGIRAGISAQRELWNLVKSRRVSQHQRREDQAFIEERLGSLLLGQQLTPAQQGDYVRRLAGTAGYAAQLAQGVEVPDLAIARIPRDRMLLRAGGVPWRPFPVSQKKVAVTPLHRRMQDRMALALKGKLAGDEKSARTCVYAVGFAVAQGSSVTSWNDQDRVELSGWGLETLSVQEKMNSAPVLPAPRFLFATLVTQAASGVAQSSGGVIASSRR